MFRPKVFLFFPDIIFSLDHIFQHHFITFLLRQEAGKPAVTRREQIESKGETSRGRGNKGRGRGRGRGNGRKQKDGQPDDSWYYEETLACWFWVADEYKEDKTNVVPRKRKPAPKKGATPKKEAIPKKKLSPKKNASPKDKSSSSKAEEKPKSKDDKDSKKRTNKSKDKADDENASKKPRKSQAAQGSKKRKDAIEPIPGPPTTTKQQREEILNFLLEMKDVPEENAKTALRSMLPNYSANGFDCSPDIYWVRKGVKGIGCGVRCQSEGKNVGFFAYRAQCNSWIFAIAAAIKSADILVTPMH